MVVEILNVISWEHTIPLMIILLVIIFKKPLSQKIKQLQVFKSNKSALEFMFGAEKESIAIPESGSLIIKNEDIVEEFKKIEWFEENEILSNITVISTNLLTNGIVNKSQLIKLISANQVQNTLSSLYSKYLERNPKKPFDPVAFSAYGPPLLLYKDKEEVIRRISIILIFSKEYIQKEKEKKIKMGDIIGEVRVDYFHIICTECGKHVKCTYKGFDPVMPFFNYECTRCGNKGSYKLVGSHWNCLPVKNE